ncbi:hypothetical protein D2V17_12045 [Aurantiacibacter xanthus]|uniref:Uncharacterized protein n=1 Tax=Aurantiacibacter xanthus TaxID=1784712 RepID=A0A3A1P521_9SPHN|nr:hypothetical protein D2V17_12045 [Aurantiacibacter xanthus]
MRAVLFFQDQFAHLAVWPVGVEVLYNHHLARGEFHHKVLTLAPEADHVGAIKPEHDDLRFVKCDEIGHKLFARSAILGNQQYIGHRKHPHCCHPRSAGSVAHELRQWMAPASMNRPCGSGMPSRTVQRGC